MTVPVLYRVLAGLGTVLLYQAFVCGGLKGKQTFRERGTPDEGSGPRVRLLAWLSDACCAPTRCRRTVPHSGECTCLEGCQRNLYKAQM